MQYKSIFLALSILFVLGNAFSKLNGFVHQNNVMLRKKHQRKMISRSSRHINHAGLFATTDDTIIQEKITVRFINTVNGRDVVAKVFPGDNLLAVGDANGVALPRACRTGLCGSCTCEVKDPEAIATSTNPRDGFATIRACSTKCFVPNGAAEMVVDVYRMRDRAMAQAAMKDGTSRASSKYDKDDYVDPMARFAGNWEKEFRPRWELAAQLSANEMNLDGVDTRGAKTCTTCRGLCRTQCYHCEGRGRVQMEGTWTRQMSQCQICAGQCSVPCATCQGKGFSTARQRRL